MFPAEPLPDQIGTYKVLRRLPGQGSIETYLGRTEGPMGFHRDCVLKVMPNNAEGDARFAEDLAREAAICSQMNHPAIVRMFDFFEHENKVVLVLEHIEGVNLALLLEHLAEKHKKLGDVAIFYIGYQIADAVAHAHAATDERGRPTPIIHRNLHPENILVALDGRVRLTGFGVGKIMGRTPDTAIGTIKGRPGYMAPEQARGEPVTPKADVYGLGLLLWSLFSGRRPPTDGSWPAKLSTLRTDLPREILAMIDAALDRFPGTRKISAREIERWLHKVVPADKGKTELKDEVTRFRDEHPPDSTEMIVPVQPPPVVAVPPASVTAVSAVRFGAPPPGTPPPPPVSTGSRKREDWRQSIPDVDNLDQLFEATKAPRGDTTRGSAPDASLSSAEAGRGAPAVARGTLPGMPAAPIAISKAPSVPELPPPESSRPPTSNRAPIPPGAPDSSKTLPSSTLAASPAAPPVAPPVALPLAPPVAPPVAPPMAPPAAPPPAPTFQTSETLPPPPDLLPAKRSTLPWKDTQLGGGPGEKSTSPSLAHVAPRPVSMGTTIAVSAVTATVVVTVGLWWFLRNRAPRATDVPATETSATASATTAARSPPPRLSPPPPSATAVASVSTTIPPSVPPTAVPPTAAPAAATVTVRPQDLPYGYGYVNVTTGTTADVYLNGKLLGPANEPLKVSCGRYFLRLGATGGGRYPEWISAGQTVNIACQGMTVVEAQAASPAPKKR